MQCRSYNVEIQQRGDSGQKSSVPLDVIRQAHALQNTVSTVSAVEYLRSVDIDYLTIERPLLGRAE